MKIDELLKLLETQISADRICHTAQAIHELDQWNSFDKYHQTADLIERQFHEARADAVERLAIPCDGETTFGDWVMPLAWDAQEGTLELTDAEGKTDLVLADYKAVPNSLARWCAPTDGPRELPLLYLSDAAKEKAWESAGAKGKMVFTHTRAMLARPWAVKYGAAGIVSDYSTAPEAYPREVQWENDWTDLALWGTTKKDAQLVGFMISPNMGKELQARLTGRRPPRSVRASVRAKFYAGATDIVTATIEGALKPNEEIVCYAHVHEQQIDDNATSAAACIEMVRAARKLIDAGVLPRPARTIRFVHGWEWIGSTYYAMHRRTGKGWIASLCLDGMAHKQELTRSPIGISMSPTTAASFADALFVDIWKQQFSRLRTKAWRTTGWGGGTDTYWIDPHMGGVSNVYPFQQCGPAWHKSHTNVDMIDRDVARGCSTACLAWMLSVASAGAKEAARFARLAGDRIERRIRKYAAGFDFNRRDVDAARAQFLDELSWLEEAGRRMIDTSHLAPEDAALPKTIDQLQDRLSAAIEEVRLFAQGALAAARSSLSDWEARRPADLARDRDERVADNLIPTRQVTGYLWSLQRFSSEDRRKFQELGRIDPIALFLCDGKRTLRQVARRREFEQGPVDLRNLLRQFRMLAEAGYVQLASRHTFTADELLKDLRELGVRDGDTILVHSSLSSLGTLAEGAETAFKALQQAVGKEGTLVMPSFCYATRERAVYDPAQSPSKVGELADLFWRRPGVLRSRHPSHGLAAQGRWAEAIVEGNEKLDPYSIGGAFGKLYQLDAKIVFIGCGVISNSSLHAVEDWAAFPTMVPLGYHYLDADGQCVEVEYAKIPQFNRDFYTYGLSNYERLFREKGILREGRTGLARSFILRSRDVMEYGLELLQKGSFDFLLPKNSRDPIMQEIEAKAKTEWEFPQEIWDEMKALRETPPG